MMATRKDLMDTMHQTKPDTYPYQSRVFLSLASNHFGSGALPFSPLHRIKSITHQAKRKQSYFRH